MHQLWCGGDANDALLQELFLQRLPSNVRIVLAPSGTDITLDNLAEMADRIMEVSTPTVAVMCTYPEPSTSADIASLRTEVHQLQELVNSLTSHSRDSRRCSLTPICRHSPSLTHQQLAVDSTLCWYHQHFGDAATKCRPPCSRGLNDQARR